MGSRGPVDFSRTLREAGFTHLLLAENLADQGVQYDPTLSRLAEAEWSAGDSDGLLELAEYRFRDADGGLRRYRLGAGPVGRVKAARPGQPRPLSSSFILHHSSFIILSPAPRTRGPSGITVRWMRGSELRGGRAMAKTVALLGALDTKGAEYGFVKQCIEARGHRTLLIDVGVLEPPAIEPDVSRREVAEAAGADFDELVAADDRGEAVAAMARGAAALVPQALRRRPVRRRSWPWAAAAAPRSPARPCGPCRWACPR